MLFFFLIPLLTHTPSTIHLDLDGGIKGLLLLGCWELVTIVDNRRTLLTNAVVGLGAHDSSTPVAAVLIVLLVVALLEGGDELGELSLVLGADLGQGEDGSGLGLLSEWLTMYHRSSMKYLLVDDSAETSLALDDGVGSTHLAAERGKEDDKLNRVDIVGNEDERSLLVLNQADDVVETVLDGVGLLGDILLLLASLNGLGLLDEARLLLGLGLRTVLVEEAESLGGQVLVGGVLELGNRRGDLQAHVEDLLLALKTDILGPLDEAREVALGLNILTNTEVARALLDKRVLLARCVSRVHLEVGIFIYLGLLVKAGPGLGERRGSGLLSGFSLRRLWSLRDFESANILHRKTKSALESRDYCSVIAIAQRLGPLRCRAHFCDADVDL